MSTQSNHFVRRTTALLGAIAASSLLGLPALAGGLNRDASTILDQAQAPSNNNQTECTPISQSNSQSNGASSANSATGTANIATPEASATGAAQVPNQADPRTGATSSDQTIGSNTDRSSVNASSQANASNSQTSDFYASDVRSQKKTSGDVLSQGGATSGGFASRQVSAANNPDGYRTASSRYTSNETRTNFGYYGNNGTGMGSTSAATNSSGSMRSDSMNQSSSQSSRMTSGTTMAQCPSGTVPRSTLENRQAPDQLNQGVQTSPQSTDPQSRQSPADDNGSRAR